MWYIVCIVIKFTFDSDFAGKQFRTYYKIINYQVSYGWNRTWDYYDDHVMYRLPSLLTGAHAVTFDMYFITTVTQAPLPPQMISGALPTENSFSVVIQISSDPSSP